MKQPRRLPPKPPGDELEEDLTQIRRRAIAVLALVGVFISTYLLLYKLGVYGSLVCGAGGGCDYVQASMYGRFLGIPVAGWGVGWYVAVFVLALLAGSSGLRAAAWPGRALLVLASGGLAFSVYLTYLELFVIHAICRWCVASAIVTTLIFVLSVPWFGSGPQAEAPSNG